MRTPCNKDPDRWVSRKRLDIEAAKTGCRSCPIKEACRAECLEYEALAGEIKRGVYGGLSEVERTNLLMQSA